MNQISSPFLKDMPSFKSRSRTIRKKIYKYLQAHHNHHHQNQNENKTNLKRILEGRVLPNGMLIDLEDMETSSLSFLENIVFPNCVDLQGMRTAVCSQ
jgi:hypothetical protein